MKSTIEEHLCAIYANTGTFISYNTLEVFDEEEGPGIRLLSEAPSPEQRVILQDLFQKLREDSRWLLSIIQNRPELVATPITGRVTKAAIIQFLRKKKWNRVKIDLVIREVAGFLVEIGR